MIIFTFSSETKIMKSHIVAVPTCNFRGRRGCFRGPTILEIWGEFIADDMSCPLSKAFPEQLGELLKPKEEEEAVSASVMSLYE